MKNLTTKLVKVMNETKRVAKNGRNDFHKYDYVTEADILEAVRENLVNNNVFIFTSVVQTQKEGDMTSVMTLHTLVDGDSGESMEVRGMGQGQDKGDKGSNKAITSAMKYMLMKMFLIPTGDDVEASDADGKSTGGPKVKAVAAVPAAGAAKSTYGFSNRAKATAAAPKVVAQPETDTDDSF